EILGPGTHRGDDIVDAAMSGLHDDGDIDAGFADLGEHAHAVEAGHHEVEHDGVDIGPLGAGQQLHHGVAAVNHDSLITAFLHHILDEAALYGVVVGDQNAGSHGFPCNATLSVPNRGTLADAD